MRAIGLGEKGIAFYIGKLQLNARSKIAEAYRNGILKIILCTSTLLEGINLPADNIFVILLNNEKNKLRQLEFLNLIERVGRLGHAVLGNVFLITGEKEKAHSNLNAYLLYLNQKFKKAIR